MNMHLQRKPAESLHGCMLTYFHLDNNHKTEWNNDIPNNATIIGKVNWRDISEITLTCDNKVYDKNKTDKEFTIKTPTYNYTTFDLPILRSNLQKSARRENPKSGILTAISMILIKDESDKQTGLFELCRRLSIIIIEDSVFDFEYGYIIWILYAISKGMKINESLIITLLEITTRVMSLNWKDKSYSHISKTSNTKHMIKIILNSNITKIYKDLLLSLQFRNACKGMQCDYDMLNKATIMWLMRFTHDSVYIKYLNVNMMYKIKYNNNLDPNDIILASFDFHCIDIIDKLVNILELYNISHDTDKLKELIWDYSSGYNSRLDINYKLPQEKFNQDNYKEWLIIKPIFEMETRKIQSLMKS